MPTRNTRKQLPFLANRSLTATFESRVNDTFQASSFAFRGIVSRAFVLGELGCGQVTGNTTSSSEDPSAGGATLSGGSQPTGGATVGGSSSGSGGTSARCASLNAAAEEMIASKIEERSACASDDDCVQTKLSAGCSRPCGLIVNESDASEMPGVVEEACAEYRESECPKVVYPCLVSLLAIPVCRDRVCTGELPK